MTNVENFSAFVGKIVSIKMLGGSELVALLDSLDDEGNLIGVRKPQSVFVQDGELMMMPYMFTSNEETLDIAGDHVQSMALTSDTICESYREASK